MPETVELQRCLVQRTMLSLAIDVEPHLGPTGECLSLDIHEDLPRDESGAYSRTLISVAANERACTELAVACIRALALHRPVALPGILAALKEAMPDA